MNAIVIHTTQPLFENARLSVEAAASRWGCDIQLLSFPYEPHPSFARLALLEHVAKWDRVLVLDPDIILSGDCPNPFTHLPREVIGMVPEVQDTKKPYPWAQAISVWSDLLGHPANPSRHLNGGYCVYTPSLHSEGIKRMAAWWHEKGRLSTSPIYEQPLWHEIGELREGLPIRRLSTLLNQHTWNMTSSPLSYGVHVRTRKACAIKYMTDWHKPAATPFRLSVTLRDKLWTPKACFHENVAVVGPDKKDYAYVAASVTSGHVTWINDFGDKAQTLATLRPLLPFGSKLVAISRPEPEWEGLLNKTGATLSLR